MILTTALTICATLWFGCWSHLLIVSEWRQILQDEPLLHGRAQRRKAVIRANHHRAHLWPWGAVGRLFAGIVSFYLLLSPAGGGDEVEFLLGLPPVLLHHPSLPSSSFSLPVLRVSGWRIHARLVHEVWNQSCWAGTTAAAAAASIFLCWTRQRFGTSLWHWPAALSIPPFCLLILHSYIFPLRLVLQLCWGAWGLSGFNLRVLR